MPEAERYQHYELFRRSDGSLWELGRGAMGITYKAYDTNLRCPVALKVINPVCLESDTARQRFLREARAAAALRHQNVASVFHLGTDHGNYFYAMEFIDGETVEACVKRKGRLEPAEALNVVLQVTRALAAASKQRLVHRDLKPANLMLVDEEGDSNVKVIDFGLAKSAKDAGDDSSTLTMGGFVGTPHFASPEQVEEGETDIRSDIYSLGATLYFIVTGKLPFYGSVGQVMSQHLYKPISMEPLTEVPRCVASLIQRMMEKDRKLRPQTPRELQDAILDCLEQIRVPTPPRSADTAAEAPSDPLGTGVILARNYRLIEELRDTPQGRKFLADDLRYKRRVSVLVLSAEFVSVPSRFTALEVAVDRVRSAPHPLLRTINALETAAGYSILVEEPVIGPSLLDVLRARHVFNGPEVVRLVTALAPVADHATSHGLQHIDLTLPGIHLLDRTWEGSGVRSEALQRRLFTSRPPELLVDAIDFAFSSSHADTSAGLATRVQASADGGWRGSCLRQLSLLAYELLDGPRARVEATGQYTPIAGLTEEGNATLRRGLVDECPTAVELARQLAAAVGTMGPTAPASQTVRPATSSPVPKAQPDNEALAETPKRRTPRVSVGRLVSLLGLFALLGCGGYLIYRVLNLSPPIPGSPSYKLEPVPRPTELAALSVRTEPAGAAVLLDGKPGPGGTFAHVPFGKHQLTATLDGYLPFRQELQVTEGMNPAYPIKLEPVPRPVELAALSVQSEPAGASVRLDGKPAAQLPGTFTHVPFGKHQLTATLDGYLPFSQELEVREGMAPDVRVKLTRRPPVELAELTVRTEPPGASVLLDGKAAAQPPGTFTHVPFGKHQLTATLEGYLTLTQALDVHEGMAPDVRVKLEPVPRPTELAALSVQTDPPGAKVLLDGKPGPAGTFAHVPFGKHQLTASLEGYLPLQRELQVREGMNPDLRLKLEPVPRPTELAALSVRTEPAGAAVLLDGQPASQLPGTFAHVPFGRHQLTATLDGYLPFSQELQVTEGMNPDLRLKLEPVPRPVELAALSVQSEPAGASVRLDGKPAAQLPGTFTHVPFGKHQLTATLDGYLPFSQELEVREGMGPEVGVKLTRRPPVELAELTVRTEPAGASVLLDGKPAAQLPGTFTHVPFGKHRLTATLDAYLPFSQELQVSEGMAPVYPIKLVPVPRPVELALLTVQSEPAGASVLLDGKAAAQPPGTFTHVGFGQHQLTASLDGYLPLQRELQVREGMNPELRLKLEPVPRPTELAALSVRTEPAGAAVLLDGKAPEAGGIFTHVSFGQHHLAATLDGFAPVQQELAVRADTVPEVALRLVSVSIASPEYLHAYVQLVQYLTDFRAATVNEHTSKLENIFETLRTQKPPISKDEFNRSYRESTEVMANHDMLPAMLLIAEHENDQEALKWFRRAVEIRDDSYAMMKVGRLYLKKGTPKDDEEGFRWLNRAFSAPKPNLDAGAYIGDCYLTGKGTKQDAVEAARIVLPLAEKRVVSAMVLAGRIFEFTAEEKQAEADRSNTEAAKQKLMSEVNELYGKARQWWATAEKDDWNAAAHLALCYQKGWGGLEQSDEEAEKRYKGGAEHGNPLSMYLYGLFLIEKKPNRRGDAERFISQAAVAGIPSAKRWCKENRVKVSETIGGG